MQYNEEFIYFSPISNFFIERLSFFSMKNILPSVNLHLSLFWPLKNTHSVPNPFGRNECDDFEPDQLDNRNVKARLGGKNMAKNTCLSISPSEFRLTRRTNVQKHRTCQQNWEAFKLRIQWRMILRNKRHLNFPIIWYRYFWRRKLRLFMESIGPERKLKNSVFPQSKTQALF